MIALRLAECDYYLGRHRAARDALRPYLRDTSREAEARFFHHRHPGAWRQRRLRHADARARDRFSRQQLGEENVNNLASHYITAEEDDQADLVLRELTRRFPRGRFADRAAWKIGWTAYKQGDFAQTASVFEVAARRFPARTTGPPGCTGPRGVGAISSDRCLPWQSSTGVVAADYANRITDAWRRAQSPTAVPPVRPIVTH